MTRSLSRGSGGSLSLAQNLLVTVSSNDGKLSFAPANESREANAMSGTIRQLVNNMVIGVSKGFEKSSAWWAWATRPPLPVPSSIWQ